MDDSDSFLQSGPDNRDLRKKRAGICAGVGQNGLIIIKSNDTRIKHRILVFVPDGHQPSSSPNWDPVGLE